mmetsp:Transcript_28766/g.91832  ORF Transcript_28766/g.91832 Transcript_28766/m.91832 type:complete len:236 (-) Transcript_28766:53-760(-)
MTLATGTSSPSSRCSALASRSRSCLKDPALCCSSLSRPHAIEYFSRQSAASLALASACPAASSTTARMAASACARCSGTAPPRGASLSWGTPAASSDLSLATLAFSLSSSRVTLRFFLESSMIFLSRTSDSAPATASAMILSWAISLSLSSSRISSSPFCAWSWFTCSNPPQSKSLPVAIVMLLRCPGVWVLGAQRLRRPSRFLRGGEHRSCGGQPWVEGRGGSRAGGGERRDLG